MNLDPSLCRTRLSQCGRPDVNAVAERNQSESHQPRVVRDTALLGRIFTGDDMPGGQVLRLLMARAPQGYFI